jgi:hypothetical protein
VRENVGSVLRATQHCRSRYQRRAPLGICPALRLADDDRHGDRLQSTIPPTADQRVCRLGVLCTGRPDREVCGAPRRSARISTTAVQAIKSMHCCASTRPRKFIFVPGTASCASRKNSNGRAEQSTFDFNSRFLRQWVTQTTYGVTWINLHLYGIAVFNRFSEMWSL